MSVLLKFIYRFSEISKKIPALFETRTLSRFFDLYVEIERANAILKKEDGEAHYQILKSIKLKEGNMALATNLPSQMPPTLPGASLSPLQMLSSFRIQH